MERVFSGKYIELTGCDRPKVSVFVPLRELPEILDTVLASGG